MQQCVIGVFETAREAGIAKENLHAGGFPDSLITSEEAAMGRDKDTGGVGGFFRDLFGVNEHPHIDHYSHAVERGHAVVIVDAKDDSEADRAKFIMERAGAFDVEARAEQWIDRSATRETGMAKPRTVSPAPATVRAVTTPASAAPKPAAAKMATGGNEKIPVVQEELHVGKREVERGRVRIYTRVIEKPVEQTVNLREQRVLVERRPADRAATDADWAKSLDREFELRTTVEEPVIQKTARVVEEVEIGRETKEHTETVRDTVRRTDVDVENMDVPQSKPERARKPGSTEKRQTP